MRKRHMKFEYKIVEYHWPNHKEVIEKSMNEYGEDGWDIISIEKLGKSSNDKRIYYKRKKVPNKIKKPIASAVVWTEEGLKYGLPWHQILSHNELLFEGCRQECIDWLLENNYKKRAPFSSVYDKEGIPLPFSSVMTIKEFHEI